MGCGINFEIIAGTLEKEGTNVFLFKNNMLPVPGQSHSRKPSYTRSPETLHFSLVGSFSNGIGEKCALNFL